MSCPEFFNPPQSASLAAYRLDSVRFQPKRDGKCWHARSAHTRCKTYLVLLMFSYFSLFSAGILKAPWTISARFVGATGTAWKLQSEHCYRQSCIRQPCQTYLDMCIVFDNHLHRLRFYSIAASVLKAQVAMQSHLD